VARKRPRPAAALEATMSLSLRDRDLRILYVVFAVFPFVPGLLVYAVLWFALPESGRGDGRASRTDLNGKEQKTWPMSTAS
jgi:hypothetical protein